MRACREITDLRDIRDPKDIISHSLRDIRDPRDITSPSGRKYVGGRTKPNISIPTKREI
jgi:hypothetical protein